MFWNKSTNIKIVNKDIVFVENGSKLLAAFLPMIESLCLPGKGSSESSEKGKKGKITDHFQVNTGQITHTHMHDFNTGIQRQTDNIQHKKLFCEMKPLFAEY